MGASASMSKVKHAAALTPAGHVIGAGGTALLARPAPLAGPEGAASRPALVIRASRHAGFWTGFAMLDTGKDVNRS